MADGLSVGAAVVVGGVFVGSVIVYTVSKCKKTALTTCVKKKAATVARKTSEITTEAKRAFSEGFTKAYHGTQEAPATAT